MERHVFEKRERSTYRKCKENSKTYTFIASHCIGLLDSRKIAYISHNFFKYCLIKLEPRIVEMARVDPL